MGGVLIRTERNSSPVLGMDDFTIKCASTATRLRFFGVEGDYFHAELSNPEFHGATRIWGYKDYSLHLAELFESMAMNWQGWKDKQEWSSIEGDLHVTCTSDSVGHVFMTVELNNQLSANPFFLKTTLVLEAGQLELLAKEAGRFFGKFA